MTEDLNTPMLHMRLPSRGSKILRRITMTEQEQIKAMTKEDIKKALETCILGYCTGCPYNGCDVDCRDELHKDVLTLITEQEKEIERLRTTLGQCNTELNSALESLKSQCREIGKLKAEVKQAKIDVLNELKGRVRTSYVLDDFILGNVVFSKDIDEFIEEIKNEQDTSNDTARG